MSTILTKEGSLEQEIEGPKSSIYDLVDHPTGTVPLGNLTLSLHLDTIKKKLEKVFSRIRGKSTSGVTRSWENVSKETLETIDSIEFLVEQTIHHEAEFKGFSSLTQQQVRNNMNTALRVVRNLEQKGFISTIPKAESMVTELDQLRKLVFTKDLMQLKEVLGDSQVLFARNWR
jgi:hypothetical protein